ncbi:NmrA family NAD(P)-binding protein [Streptomyces marincola]|uniref:NmrA family transcriptional regulator n=1 Tax=Streptomyces marincola TaxID=2878388 RepID=A0A1W7D1V6_9ACTN|nr:NAD(P)H-binding protein [Streptomyces marincola]ARQ70530.1 NmrA family transcriptional regulator [Streptomyces marincola]
MTIVVTTPTGNVGSRVVRLLLQAGVRPRVLLRAPGRLEPGVRALVDARRGDLTDARFVREALAGATAAFLVDPTPHTVEDPVGASRRTGAAFAAAVRDSGVRRVVFLSSAGAELRHGAGHIDGLAAIEQQLDRTGADVLHLRCGYFFTNLLLDLDGLAAGELTTSGDPDRRMPWVDPRDIGDIAAARLLNAGWSGRSAQGVHGPEDLSWRRIAEVLTAALGRAIGLRVVSDDDVRAGLAAAGLPPGAVDGIVGMTAGTRALDPEQPRDAVTTTPTDLAGWAHARLRPLLPAPGS